MKTLVNEDIGRLIEIGLTEQFTLVTNYLSFTNCPTYFIIAR